MRGATYFLCIRQIIYLISIHAPHAGCDSEKHSFNGMIREFQSTHPMRGATDDEEDEDEEEEISIHAPHAGCDYSILGYAVH